MHQFDKGSTQSCSPDVTSGWWTSSDSTKVCLSGGGAKKKYFKHNNNNNNMYPSYLSMSHSPVVLLRKVVYEVRDLEPKQRSKLCMNNTGCKGSYLLYWHPGMYIIK